MANEVRLEYPKWYDQSDQIEYWLRNNAGIGSIRYGGREGEIRHWLNGDDWLYYMLYPESRDSALLEESITVFIFKYEKTAIEFALRFA